jgi:hypothetical protein
MAHTAVNTNRALGVEPEKAVGAPKFRDGNARAASEAGSLKAECRSRVEL